MSVSSPDSSPIHRSRCGSSDGERDGSPYYDPVSERPERMRDWIIRMINSGRFIGLQWMDEEKTVFRVPWIHAKKRGYNRERDAALFREWAKHSGKFREDSDPTVWKINFRCAINGLKDIMEIKDMQTEDCRVYKVLPSRSRAKRRCPRAQPNRQRGYSDPYPTSLSANFSADMSGHIYSPAHAYAMPHTTSIYNPAYTSVVKHEFPSMAAPACMAPLPPTSFSSYPCTSTSATAPGMTIPTSHIVEPECCIPTSSQCISSSPPHREPTFFKQEPLAPVSIASMTTDSMVARQGSPDSLDSGIVEPQTSPLMAQNSPLMAQNSPLMPDQQFLVNSPPIPISMPSTSIPSISSSASSLCDDDTDIVDIVNELEKDHPPTPPHSATLPSSELEVTILYGSIVVHTETIDCSTKACRIFSNSRQPHKFYEDEKSIELFTAPCSESHPIELPESHPNAMSEEIFSAMRRGVVVEQHDGNIYVTPLCRTVVYCGGSTAEPSVPLEKDQRTKVFDYSSYFRPALEHYAFIHNNPPSPSVILGLGQSWGIGRDITNNLMSVVITHKQAKQEMSQIDLPHVLAPDPIFLDLPESVDIDTPNSSDLVAAEFLKQYITAN